MSTVAEDLTTLFMELYDDLGDDPFEGSRVVEEWLADQELWEKAELVEGAVVASGTADPELVAGIINEDGDKGKLTVLLGLDGALWRINPFAPKDDQGALVSLAGRYAVLGRFNEDDRNGALLPVCSYPGRPYGLVSKVELFGVLRVPLDEWVTIDHAPVPTRHELAVGRDSVVMVASSPLIGSMDELVAERTFRAGKPAYRLSARDSDGLRERIALVLTAMDASTAMIGLLPEATLCAGLLPYWQDLVQSQPASSKSSLKWLIVGTGPTTGSDPPVNRATVLDRDTGEVIFFQDKTEPFTFDADQLRDWHLSSHFGEVSAVEDIWTGNKLFVAEGALGRVTILICEDLTRRVKWAKTLGSIRVSHIFVSVFSKPIEQYRWQNQEADRWVTELGAWVIVANSLAVASAQGKTGPVGTCIAVGPSEQPGQTWTVNNGQLPTLNDPSEVAVVQIRAGNGNRWRMK